MDSFQAMAGPISLWITYVPLSQKALRVEVRPTSFWARAMYVHRKATDFPLSYAAVYICTNSSLSHSSILIFTTDTVKNNLVTTISVYASVL